MRGPIVVGADGSENSRLALEEAASMAKASGRTVVVAFVRHVPLAGFGVPWTGGMSVGYVQEVLNANESFAEAESIAILDSAGVPWRFEVREGEPATELMRLATAAGADTIVVAGKRHRALGAMACSSVCAQLLHRWSRSLMVIHPHADVTDTDRTTAPGDQR